MRIHELVDEGMGNSSYVLDLGGGDALLLDPVRDPAVSQAVLEREGLRARAALDTHLHADFVSGGREWQALGAALFMPAGAEPAFSAHLLEDGDTVDLNGLTVQAIATPGHTFEHMAYLLSDGGRPLALFSGGTLIPGGVARPDLLGPEHTEPLARAAYRSIHERLLALPDELPVYPTHGPGSFCSAGGGGRRTTTIGHERAHNPLLAAADEDAFVRLLLADLGSYPPYFLELRDVNRAGPVLHGPDPLPVPWLDAAAVKQAMADGAEVVDPRPIEAYARGHVPDSLSIAWRAQFAVWLGWLVDRSRPLILIDDDSAPIQQVLRAALSVGHDLIAGVLRGGVDAWRGAGEPLARIPLRPADAADPRRTVLDVRQEEEWRRARVPGAVHQELGALAPTAAQPADPPSGPLLVHCGIGDRAMSAASLLARRGIDVAVIAGAPSALAEPSDAA